MSSQERMTIQERIKYLRIMQRRYAGAGRGEKSGLLDEMEEVTGLDRKTLIRKMKGRLGRALRMRQRGRRYGAGVDDALRVIAESLDYISAERMQPSLVAMADDLARHGELRLNAPLREQLGRISVSTVARIMKRVRQDDTSCSLESHEL